jgi:sortase A
MRVTSWIFVFAGVVTFLYPLGKDGYRWMAQHITLSDFEREMNQFERKKREDQSRVHYEALREVFLNLEDNKSGNVEKLIVELEHAEEREEEIAKEETREELTNRDRGALTDKDPVEKAIGILYIDKIQLKLPILNGSTASHLEKGAGHLPGTDLLGEFGNTAIAAHRSHTYGRFFNRLNELEKGDIIRLKSLAGEFQYDVYDVKIVHPNDLSILNRNGKEKIITLITCDPIYEATHRLIVHAKMKEE